MSRSFMPVLMVAAGQATKAVADNAGLATILSKLPRRCLHRKE